MLDHLIMVVDGQPDRLPEVLDLREGQADAAHTTLARELREANVRTSDELYGALTLHYVVPGTKLVSLALAYVRYLGAGECRAEIYRADGSHILTIDWEVD